MKKNHLFIIILSFLFVQSYSQYFGWKVGLNGIADNREYFNKFIAPQTIFGSRVFGELGFGLNDYHSLHFGLNYLYEFGSEGDLRAPDIIMYYHGQNKNFDLYMGAFPRRGLIEMPYCMLTDTLMYYRPNVEGMFFQAKQNWGYQNVWVDWTSRQTDTKRETFLIGATGKIMLDRFFYTHNLLMYHYAGPAVPIPGDHIRDNGGMTAMVGVNLSHAILDSVIVASGFAGSYDRKRNVYDFNFAGGWFSQVTAIYKGIGLKLTYYQGGKVISKNEGSDIPVREGLVFLYGDGFYKSGQYTRLDMFWLPFQKKRIKAKFQISLHFIPGVVDISQSFVLYYDLQGRKPLELSGF